MPPETITTPVIRTRRLPRYRRASHEERPPFKLTERDRELLKAIYEYRFITAEMLQDLAPPVALTPRQQEAVERLITARRSRLGATDTAARPPTSTKREIQRWLQAMYHHGYVHRIGTCICPIPEVPVTQG